MLPHLAAYEIDPDVWSYRPQSGRVVLHAESRLPGQPERGDRTATVWCVDKGHYHFEVFDDSGYLVDAGYGMTQKAACYLAERAFSLPPHRPAKEY